MVQGTSSLVYCRNKLLPRSPVHVLYLLIEVAIVAELVALLLIGKRG